MESLHRGITAFELDIMNSYNTIPRGKRVRSWSLVWDFGMEII